MRTYKQQTDYILEKLQRRKTARRVRNARITVACSAAAAAVLLGGLAIRTGLGQDDGIAETPATVVTTEPITPRTPVQSTGIEPTDIDLFLCECCGCDEFCDFVEFSECECECEEFALEIP
jgi:hypothetical protein